MPEADLRRIVGKLCAAFGAAHLLPVAFVWLSSGGPTPVTVSAAAWSAFFYGHFVALVVVGLGAQAVAAARSKLFHGGPMIDFLIGVAGFMVLESLAAIGPRAGTAAALLPGAALAAFGLRLTTGRPLLKA